MSALNETVMSVNETVISPIEYYANKMMDNDNGFTKYTSKQLSVLCDFFITKWKMVIESSDFKAEFRDNAVDFTKDVRLVFSVVDHVITNQANIEELHKHVEFEADDETLTELIKFNEFTRNIKTLSNITKEDVLNGYPSYINILTNAIEYIVTKNNEMEQLNETIKTSVKETLAKVNETLSKMDEMISQKKFV